MDSNNIGKMNNAQSLRQAEYDNEYVTHYDNDLELRTLEIKLKRDSVLDSEQKSKLLADIQSRLEEIKNENQNESNDADDFVFKYDYSSYSQNFDSWEVLNPDNLPYPLALRDIILPSFHPLPEPSIQNDIVSISCLINTIALPPLGVNCAMETPLSNLYIQGVPGSGKTQLAHLMERHYPARAVASVKGDTSGGALIESFHDACFVRDGDGKNPILRPALGILENFYADNIKRWGNYAVALLATERKDAKSRRGGSDGQIYYSWLFKIFTSIHPLESTSERASELARRTLKVFCEKDVPLRSTGSFDWRSQISHYVKIWNPYDVQNRFFPVLAEVMSKADNETTIPPHYYPPSKLYLAVGVYLGIWNDLDEAIAKMTRYWEFIDSHSNVSTDILAQLVTEYINEHYFNQRRLKQNKKYSVDLFDKEWNRSLTNIMDTIELKSSNVYHRKQTKTVERIIELFSIQGFKTDVASSEIKFLRK